MQIKRLRIDNHRCLIDFDIKFQTTDSGSSTILIGENGAGKSTIIETILEILVSFDSPEIEKNISYSYEMQYIYAQRIITITQVEHRYRVVIDGKEMEESYNSLRSHLNTSRIFPKRIIAFYSGANDKLKDKIKNVNTSYKKKSKKAIDSFLKDMTVDQLSEFHVLPDRKYIYCDESLTSVFLVALLCGQESFEKNYIETNFSISKIKYIDMVVNADKVEAIFGRDRFEGNNPTGLYYLSDYIDHRFTDILRSGFVYSALGKSYFTLRQIDEIDVDAITILNYFEKLYLLFDANYIVTVEQNGNDVKCRDLSEGQRQLIKIFGMLGVCKSEDCLVLMDEPDAFMNPKWKYEIKNTIDKVLESSTNTQAIIATHDPLVINGVPKEYIRILEHDYSKWGATRVVVPESNTEGMGIDGLLQSEYYGLPTVLDTETKKKLDKKYDLMVKSKESADQLNDEEKQELEKLTEDLEDMTFSRNIPTDIYYDEYVAAMHKIYRDKTSVKLSKEEIEERNAKAEEILRGLLGE